ncbi:hypothetical protein AWC15_12395 [Mycobacterium lacus]|nr:hypothetical protein AWC15_12395 [Mycobacterium lacus]
MIVTTQGARTPSLADRRLLINGRLVAVGQIFSSINRATGAVLGHAPDAGVAEADAAGPAGGAPA